MFRSDHRAVKHPQGTDRIDAEVHRPDASRLDDRTVGRTGHHVLAAAPHSSPSCTTRDSSATEMAWAVGGSSGGLVAPFGRRPRAGTGRGAEDRALDGGSDTRGGKVCGSSTPMARWSSHDAGAGPFAPAARVLVYRAAPLIDPARPSPDVATPVPGLAEAISSRLGGGGRRPPSHHVRPPGTARAGPPRVRVAGRGRPHRAPRARRQGSVPDNEQITVRSRTGCGTYATVSTARRRSGFNAHARTYDEVTHP